MISYTCDNGEFIRKLNIEGTRDPDELLTREQAATYLKVKECYVTALKYQKKLPFVKCGASFYYKFKDLHEWKKKRDLQESKKMYLQKIDDFDC